MLKRFGETLRIQWLVDQDNVFGAKMVILPGGEYQFIGTNGEGFIIKTQVPIGSTWFFSGVSVSATLDTITLSTFHSITDSVMTISLSNGRTLKLSKNYGLIEAYTFLPQPSEFSETPYNYSLWGIKEAGVGGNMPGFAEVFDFDIGDEFGRVNQNGAYIYYNTDTSHSEVIGKASSITGDTLWYDFYKESIWTSTYTYPTTSTISADTVWGATYERAYYPALEVHSMQTSWVGGSPGTMVNLTTHSFEDTTRNDRTSHYVLHSYTIDPCGYILHVAKSYDLLLGVHSANVSDGKN